jgi:hypothetical protein
MQGATCHRCASRRSIKDRSWGRRHADGRAEDGTARGEVIDITNDGEDEDDVDDLLCAQNWKGTHIIGVSTRRLRVLTEECKEFHLEFPDGRKRYVRLDDIRRFPHCHAAALDFVMERAKPRPAQDVKAGRRTLSSADAGEAVQGSTLTSEEHPKSQPFVIKDRVPAQMRRQPAHQPPAVVDKSTAPNSQTDVENEDEVNTQYCK